MATRMYRVISAETMQRIPMDGIVNDRENQYYNPSQEWVIVERQDGFVSNERWLTHPQALIVLEQPEWLPPYNENDFIE